MNSLEKDLAEVAIEPCLSVLPRYNSLPFLSNHIQFRCGYHNVYETQKTQNHDQRVPHVTGSSSIGSPTLAPGDRPQAVTSFCSQADHQGMSYSFSSCFPDLVRQMLTLAWYFPLAEYTSYKTTRSPSLAQSRTQTRGTLQLSIHLHQFSARRSPEYLPNRPCPQSRSAVDPAVVKSRRRMTMMMMEIGAPATAPHEKTMARSRRQ